MAAGHGPFFLTIALTHLCINGLLATPPISCHCKIGLNQVENGPALLSTSSKIVQFVQSILVYCIGLLIEFYLINYGIINGPLYCVCPFRKRGGIPGGFIFY
eukprot:UN08972